MYEFERRPRCGPGALSRPGNRAHRHGDATTNEHRSRVTKIRPRHRDFSDAQQARCLSGQQARWAIGGAGDETEAWGGKRKKRSGSCCRTGDYRYLWEWRSDDVTRCRRSAVPSRRPGRVRARRHGPAIRHCVHTGVQYRTAILNNAHPGICLIGRLRSGHRHFGATQHGTARVPVERERKQHQPDERCSDTVDHAIDYTHASFGRCRPTRRKRFRNTQALRPTRRQNGDV